MPVQVVKTELKCKLCKSEHLAEINALLEKRSRREKDADGNSINLDYVLARFRELGVENPTVDNIKSHLWNEKTQKGHVKILTETQHEENAEQVEAVLTALRSGEMEFADLDEGMRFLATVYIEEQRTKYAKGESLGITHDHFLKLVGESTKRKRNDAQDELLKALGGGIGKVFEKALGGPPEQAAIEAPAFEIPDATEDAEIVEVPA